MARIWTPISPKKIKEIQRVHKHMKRCSTSLSFMEMQIKITERYNFTPTRMKQWERQITSVDKDVDKLLREIWQFLKKLNIELPNGPGFHHRNKCSHKSLYTNIHRSIIHNNKKAEYTQIWSTDKWVYRVYHNLFNGILFGNKKE